VKRSCGTFALGAVAAVALFGQTAARPEFEVASIKPSADFQPQHVRVGLHVDGAQVSGAALSLQNLIRIAYGVKEYEISGPDWLASERFDINAKIPAGGSEKQVPQMLQALLEDRFQMKLHRESRELPVYALVIEKNGPKLEEAPPSSAPSTPAAGPVNVSATGERRGVSINYGNGSSFTFADNRLEGRKLSAPQMADVLSRFTEKPVVDMTDLKGNYNFVLELAPEDYRAMLIRSAIAAGIQLSPRAVQLADEASGSSLFSAIEKLGLKLESRKAPLEVLVIDHAEKAPSEN
jgi:uncharacterized protein (TIGR03435 family)